jgi:hypothetical protein
MRCHVYSRVERVVYVVGVTDKTNPFAEALLPVKVDRLTGREKGKPFASMSAKNVMYVERIGCVAIHRNEKAMLERASQRASQLNLEFAESTIEEPA